MARQDAQKQETSKSRVSSKKGPCHEVGFASVTEGVVSHEDWRAIVVADLVWEIEILPGDGGWNASLAKREC
jgi:hypothetical protein